jgi:type IV secretion system protein TrbB
MSDSVRCRHEKQLSDDLGPLRDRMDELEASDAAANDSGVFIGVPGIGWPRTNLTLTRACRERVITIAASLLGTEITAAQPFLAGEIVHLGIRIQASIAPLSPGPEFVLRRPPARVFKLDDFDCRGYARVVRSALARRSNILISGATGSGKTRFEEALLGELHKLDPIQHLVLLEDTSEIRSPFEHTSARRVVPPANLRALVSQALRMSPTRIVIGEVRGAEALELLKAWNTGHPGGITTIHADSARSALSRLEQLVLEADVPPQPRLIGDVVNLVIQLERDLDCPGIADVLYVHRWDAASGEYVVQSLSPDSRIGPNGPEE